MSEHCKPLIEATPGVLPFLRFGSIADPFGQQIHIGNLAAVRQQCSRKNVIDAPAEVTLKDTIGMELSKYVDAPQATVFLSFRVSTWKSTSFTRCSV